VEIRRAGPADLDSVTALLCEAFHHDPLWRWAFPDDEHLAVWWRLYVTSALRYPSVWVAGDYAAASIWIPPGGTELTAEEEDGLAPMLRDLVGPRAAEVLEVLERFEASHPRDEPHYYLSLLGTAARRQPAAHRRRGRPGVPGVEQPRERRALRTRRLRPRRRVHDARRRTDRDHDVARAGVAGGPGAQMKPGRSKAGSG
jgi:hypothetical protein